MGYLGTIFTFLILSSQVFGAGIQAYPGSSSVTSSTSSKIEVHRLVTGEVKRVNGQNEPESADFVSGKKSSAVYEILNVGRSEDIAKHFKDQIQNQGQILFECQGRRCGASNYWANTVFGQSVLYGPTEDQHYLLGKLGGNRGDYVVVYLAKRATGKRYAYIESITDTGSETLIDRRLIASSLRLQKRFVINDVNDEALLRAIREVVNDAAFFELALVAHNSLLPNESIEAAKKRSKSRADEVRVQLEEMGADSRKLTTEGAGPISPIDRENSQRIELVLIR